MFGKRLGLVGIGRAGFGLEQLFRQDRGVEGRQRREEGRIGMLQLDGDGRGRAGIDTVDRGDKELPVAIALLGSALERPFHVFGGDRRAIGELDAVAQRQDDT